MISDLTGGYKPHFGIKKLVVRYKDGLVVTIDKNIVTFNVGFEVVLNDRCRSIFLPYYDIVDLKMI